jgi:hypothetical protein
MITRELLRLAADALDNGVDPFSSVFLGDHEVTSDQCFSLAQQLAVGARVVAAGIESPTSVQGIAMLLAIGESALR